MNQRIQNGIRTALMLVPMTQTVIVMPERDESKLMSFVLLLTLMMLVCAGAFCSSFGNRMLERLIASSGMGTLVMILELSTERLPLNMWTILVAVLFCLELLLSVLYAIGRRFWLYL